MRTTQEWIGAWSASALGLLAVWWLTGCAAPKTDWASRVGHYTFDQTVLEMGPPDKQARLQDGTLVAEWLTRRGHAHTYTSWGYTYGPGYYGPAYPLVLDSASPDYFLRLTFGPDGRLQAWKRYAR